jgi:hypothetical protein
MRIALALVLLLAGCGNGVAVSRTHYTRLGIPADVELAAAQGPTLVNLYRSPFPDPDVMAAMRAHNPRPHMSYSTAATGGPYPYRIVLGFGSRPAGGSADCRVFNQPAGPAPAGKTEMYGAFCLGDQLLSEASAVAPEIKSAGDPAFARLTGDLLAALLPMRDPLAYQYRCRFPFC